MVNYPRTNTDPQDEVKVVADLAVLAVLDPADVKVYPVGLDSVGLDWAELDWADLEVQADAKVVLAVLVDLVGLKEVRVADLDSAVLVVLEVLVVPADVKVVRADQVAHLLFPQIRIECSNMQ
jgi:hypothetical protein